MEPYKREMTMDNYSTVAEIIETMFEINDELAGADKYIHEAMKLKASSLDAASVKVSNSADELKHADNLTVAVGKMMEKLKAENNPCYGVMSMFWYHLKDSHAEWMAKIRMKHEQYKK